MTAPASSTTGVSTVAPVASVPADVPISSNSPRWASQMPRFTIVMPAPVSQQACAVAPGHDTST
jgi:hypothetical protein